MGMELLTMFMVLILSTREVLMVIQLIDKVMALIVPVSLQQLETEGGIRLVITDCIDQDEIGFVQWRVAFYAVDVYNFFLLLDGWFRFVSKDRRQHGPLRVVLSPHLHIDLSSTMQHLKHECYTLKAAGEALPLHVFEAYPVMGRKITIMNLQVEDERTLSLLLTGHTWPWRRQLDEFGIRRGYEDEEEDKENGRRQYFRVMKNITVDDEEQQDKVFALIEQVLQRRSQ